jgi:monoamine oxidase
MDIRKPLTRRSLIGAMGRIGGAGAAYEAMMALGMLPSPVRAATLELPADLGQGMSVVILGAGVSGLCAAYELDRAGYDVIVLEAQRRAGGRSLTLRRGAAFKEMGDAPLQYCEFDDGLYLNAGPGRIPHHHVHLIEYCRRFGVTLEPFIFASRANLMHSDKLPPDKAQGGRRVAQARRIIYDIQGHVAELLDKCLDKNATAALVSKADLEALHEMLAEFGDLTVDKGPPRRAHYENEDGHAGYAIPPGLAGNKGTPLGPMALEEILRSRLWDNFAFRDTDYSWQTSLLQPRGGMDQIVEGFRRQPLARRGGTIAGLVRYGARVTELEVMKPGAAAIAYEDGSGPRRISADFCISTIPMPVFAGLKSDLPAPYLKAAGELKFMPACKVGWQAKRRFWETDNQIYGGISWTTDTIDQIWYPSDGFLGAKGALTGAYNRGKTAIEFGNRSIEDRLRIAREDGERLHAGFGKLVEHGVAIAWHKMEFQHGGWANEDEGIFGPLIEILAQPQGRLHPAGDQVTWWTGWQEGAVIAAQAAVTAICERCAVERVR